MGRINKDQNRHQKMAGGVSAWQQACVKSLDLLPALMTVESGEAGLRYGQGAEGVEARPGSRRQL